MRFFALTFFLLVASVVSAQPKQDIPPFLRDKPKDRTVQMDGNTYVLPNFSIAGSLPSTGGNELILPLPIGFLAARNSSRGLQFDLRRFRNPLNTLELYQFTPNPLSVTEGLSRTPDGPVFDFTKSAPHLAFFCRLEINEERNSIIPLKFRLGGHRYWQDNLLRR
ncbi:MAG: hypothetical protein AAGA31_15130 [Bacteroidota bacterium]